MVCVTTNPSVKEQKSWKKVVGVSKSTIETGPTDADIRQYLIRGLTGSPIPCSQIVKTDSNVPISLFKGSLGPYDGYGARMGGHCRNTGESGDRALFWTRDWLERLLSCTYRFLPQWGC